MKTRDYLTSNTLDLVKHDQFPKATEPNIRKGLVAYAFCIHKGVKGYSVDDVVSLLEECGCDDKFIDNCETFVSHSCEFLNWINRLPNFEELDEEAVESNQR